MKKIQQNRDLDGFTLIELIIIIVIISILAIIGFSYYNGMQANAKDSKKKADINAIYKAYESNYKNNAYQPLQPNNFMSGQIPKTPEGSGYTCIAGPESNCATQATDRFLICTPIGSTPNTCNSSSPNCYCLASSQGASIASNPVATPVPPTSTPMPTSTLPTPTPTPTPGGGPCTITGATWSVPAALSETNVSLNVTTTGDCSGQTAFFEVRRNGYYYDDISANSQPVPVTFTAGSNHIAGQWITEYNPLIPFTDAEYYFQVSLPYQDPFESNPRLIVVSKRTSTCNATALSDGLVGYWKLDENSGTTSTDSINSVPGDFRGSTNWSTGKFNSALNFPNNSDGNLLYILNTYLAPILDHATDNSYSFTAWVYPRSAPPDIPNQNFSAALSRLGYHTFIGYDAQQKMVMRTYTTFEFTDHTAYSANTFAPNNWYYLAGVVDTTDSTVKIYVNGNLEGTTTFSDSLYGYSGYPYTIGASQNGTCTSGSPVYCLDGEVDDARVYNRALSAQEISDAYNGGTGCSLP